MKISRLRFRLTLSLGLVFLLGLVILNLALFAFLRGQASLRLTRNLLAEAHELAAMVETERVEDPGVPLERTAHEVMKEWPSREAGFAVVAGGRIQVIGGNSAFAALLQDVGSESGVWSRPSGNEHDIRFVTGPVMAGGFHVVVASSTRAMDEEMESLALWMGLSVPIMIALSLVGGYLLAGRALQPVRIMGGRLATLDAEGLRDRLPVEGSADEMDVLAGQINALLERLTMARDANRRFLRQAAHQIQTPLTLVLGEASLSLDRARTNEEQHATLTRIRIAAEQMRRRVDELFLLAQARSGAQIDLTQEVELDGLVLESTDLVRNRFSQAMHPLELTTVEPLTIRGNEWLLREATIELLENACRYSLPSSRITASVTREGDQGVLTVSSEGPVIQLRPENENGQEDHGMGLQIVRWIIEQHGGALRFDYSAGVNSVRFGIPLLSG